MHKRVPVTFKETSTHKMYSDIAFGYRSENRLNHDSDTENPEDLVLSVSGPACLAFTLKMENRVQIPIRSSINFSITCEEDSVFRCLRQKGKLKRIVLLLYRLY